MVAASGLAFIISTVAVIRLQGVRIQYIAVPLIKLYFVVAVCLLVSYSVIEPLVNSDWIELLLKCTLVPVIFLGLSGLVGLSAIKDVKALLKDHKNLRTEA